MFADAYEKAAAYTFPVVVSTRSWHGTVSSSLSAFVILNDEGWFATAAHIISPHRVWCRHAIEIAAYQEAIAAGRTKVAKAKGAKDLRPNPDWIVNQSFWWGSDGPQMVTMHVREGADLAVGRLTNFEPRPGQTYPEIVDPARLRPGTSLCRLGYPFHHLQTEWDAAADRFVLPSGMLPPPLFPIEGIFTRQVRKPGDDKPVFIETSSPGLRGQSGGPVFDARGRLWGIQSRTHHLDLGFSPEARSGERAVREHQFLNVGLAVHPAELVSLLNEKGIVNRGQIYI